MHASLHGLSSFSLCLSRGRLSTAPSACVRRCVCLVTHPTQTPLSRCAHTCMHGGWARCFTGMQYGAVQCAALSVVVTYLAVTMMLTTARITHRYSALWHMALCMQAACLPPPGGARGSIIRLSRTVVVQAGAQQAEVEEPCAWSTMCCEGTDLAGHVSAHRPPSLRLNHWTPLHRSASQR